MFQFGGLGALFGGAKPPKSPRGDGTGVNPPKFLTYLVVLCSDPKQI